MRTFSENLQFKKNMRLLGDFFTEMQLRGLSPTKFVEWYAQTGDIGDQLFHDHAIAWLGDELQVLNEDLAMSQQQFGPKPAQPPLAKYVSPSNAQSSQLPSGVRIPQPAAQQPTTPPNPQAQPTQQPAQQQTPQPQQQQPTQQAPQPQQQAFSPEAQQAISMLDNFSRKVAGRVGKRLSDSNFAKTITDLLLKLKDSNTWIPAAKPAQMAQGGPFGTPRTESHFLHHNQQKMRASQVIREFTKRNIDPNLFVEWYKNEGWMLSPRQFREEGEGLWQRIKNWGSGVWDALWGGASQYIQADNQAVNDLLNVLSQLQQKGAVTDQHAAQQLDSVIKSLQNAGPVLAKAAQQPQQTRSQPGTTQPGTTQPGTTPPSNDGAATSMADKKQPNLPPGETQTPEEQPDKPFPPIDKPHEDHWDDKAVGDMRARVDANDPNVDPEIVSIHQAAKNGSITDQEAHEKIAAHLAKGRRDLLPDNLPDHTTHGSGVFFEFMRRKQHQK